jgi:hypothetical protein
MKKCLMTVMAAVAFGGLFSGCGNDVDLSGGSTAEFNIVQNYENAFITRFGQPAATQTWGFGPASAGTRAVVGQPSVSRIGYSFNATMTMGANAASAAGLDAGSYSIWAASGWEDEVYQVNGTVDASNISSKLKAAIVNKIVGTDANPGLIPEGSNNLGKANELGYSVVTKERGPVTLTPVYHQSSSGDPIYYYYYQKGTNPDVKKLKKYSIGYMADPNVCKDNIYALNENTYSLVYEDENGNVSYNFPPNMVISFIVSNVDYKHPSTPVDVYEPGATNLSLVGRYALEAGETIQIGTDKIYDNDKIRVRFGKQNVINFPNFGKTQPGGSDTNFPVYIPGNGVNGSLIGGSTCYYFRAKNDGYLRVGVRQNGGTLKAYESKNSMELSSENNWSGGNFSELTADIETPSSNDGFFGFPVKEGFVYAVYSENAVLGYYGYNYYTNKEDREPAESKPMPSWGEITCGEIFGSNYGCNYIEAMVGRKQVFGKTKNGDGDNPIANFPALTEGTGINGSLSTPGATVYYIRPNESGVLRVAVKLSKGKTLKVVDLGAYQWHQTSGTEILSKSSDADNAYYGTVEFDVESTHVYAVYAEGSKLGYYGCEFLTKSSSTGGTKTIDNHPEFYGDGNYNTAIHTSGLGWTVNPSTTPHAAVFNTELTDEDDKKVKVSLIGFEDWTDLDFNDVIFAVTGAEPEVEQPPVIIEVPDDPEGFVCRIVAEDLTVGENSDFDFNDVVFDVFCDGSKTTIRLRAAGGELPLYVAGHEVHKEFGYNSSYPIINTGWDGTIDYEKRYVDFTIDGVYNTRALANTIPVYVTKRGEDKELKDILLTAREGKVASKVCVGRDYEWCSERLDVDNKFHKQDGTKLFQQYVVGNFGDDWDAGTAWYQFRGK